MHIGLVNTRFRTPAVSIFYVAVVAAVFIVVGNLDMIIIAASFVEYPFPAACSAGILVMRITHPDLPRPYRVPLIFPVLQVIFGSYVFILPFLGEGWLMCLIWVVVGLTGEPVYYLMSKNVCLSGRF